MFTVQGMGRSKQTVSHLHTIRSTMSYARTHACTHAHTQQRQVGRESHAAIKEVCLESGPERINIVYLPDVPGQGIPLGRGDIYLKARWPYRFVLQLQSLVPGTSRNDLLADWREWDGVYGGMMSDNFITFTVWFCFVLAGMTWALVKHYSASL